MVRTLTETHLKAITRPDFSCRTELIEVQKAIVNGLRDEIERSVGKTTREYQAYLEDYNRVFTTYQRTATITELMASVLKANIIYNGDYHTMAQSQRIPLRILREIVPRRPGMTLAVEVVHIEHQAFLDAFISGKLREDDFLRSIDYDKTWGFAWDHYRDLFVFARQHGIKVLGINTEPRGGRWVLKKRDRAAAQVIAREYLKHPDNLLYVVDGDLHIAPSHLPAMVDDLLAPFDEHPETVTLFQNNEEIYWALARKRLEQETDVVLLRKGQYCIMSTPPIIKLQSYFNWIDNTRQLTAPTFRNWYVDLVGEEDLYNQVLKLVKIVAQFLEIEADDLDDFVVYSPADLDFLDRLRHESGLSLEEIRAVAAHLRTNESYFIENGNIIYIANLSINHAAEEATHFIHKVCAGPRRADLTQTEDFYCRIMREALGFFGSKILNHKRHCHSVEDFRHPERSHPTLRPGRIEELKTIGTFASDHKAWERVFLGTGRMWKLEGPVFELPLAVHLGVTHALGYMLGNRIFDTLMRGRLDKQVVRELFFMNFSELEQSLQTYLEWIALLAEAENA
jgi:DNA-binding transcriptional MerR regulator